MRIISTFPWCKKYGVKYIEIVIDMASRHVIVTNANKIKGIKHKCEVYNFISNYEDIINNKFMFILKWLWFNLTSKHNKHFKYER